MKIKMANYKCRECGKCFDTPRKYTNGVEVVYTCPYCDGDDFDDACVVAKEEEEDENEN